MISRHTMRVASFALVTWAADSLSPPALAASLRARPLSSCRQSDDVLTTLTYRINDGNPHWQLARPLDEGEEANGGAISTEEVVIRSARSMNVSLDNCGFELLRDAPTRLSTQAFYDSAIVQQLYYNEIAALLRQRLGCAHVHVFSHSVRNKQREGERSNDDGVVQGYGFGPHVDVSAYDAAAICEGMTARAESNYGYSLRKGRCLYVNAWRNIDTSPVEADPFAVCDARSVVAPDDIVLFHLETPAYGIVQYRLGNAHLNRHRWYYFPYMSNDELLVFKQWDSDPDLPARFCFHSAFQLPWQYHPSIVPRQSCEVRALCFFPDASADSFPRTRQNREP